jgi:hypothetical protein
MEVDTPIRNIVPLPDGRFDCEIEHPLWGWIPFTADANDVEPHGRAIHAAIVALLNR